MPLPLESRQFDAAVVGGGPAGLASALLAASLGRSVALVAPPRPEDERSTALLAGTIPLFRSFRVWERIAESAAPLKRIRIVDASGRLIRAPEILFDSAEVGLEAFGYSLPNRTLTAILDEAVGATGIARFQAFADAIEPYPDRVDIDTSDGERVSTRLLIAADGRNSKARETAGIAVTEWRYEQAALVVNLRHALPHEDTSTEFHTPTGPFTLVPLGANRSGLVCVESAAGAARLAELQDSDLAAEIERRSHSILGAVTIDGPRQVFPLGGMRAAHFAARRIALVGEAAHVIPPIGAQGLNLGLRDVAALAEMLRGTADPGSDARLADFNRRRRADVFGRTSIVDGLNRSLLTDSLLVQGARSAAIAALDTFAPLRRAVMRQGLAGAVETRRTTRAPEPPRQGKRSAGRIRLPIR